MNSVVEIILDNFNLYFDDYIGTSRCKTTYGELVDVLVHLQSYEEASKVLGISIRSLERILVQFRVILGKPPKYAWDSYLLMSVDLDKCASCTQIKTLKDFTTGSLHLCKECSNARGRVYKKSLPDSVKKERSKSNYLNNRTYYAKRNAVSRAKFKIATPKWADLIEIQRFYLNRPEGFHVDHVVPLNGVNVCGLHVIENLQYLSAFDNISKGNRFTG